jgi:Na+-translocating ferredoxin:NAD+ oxidoreductase subunit E
VNTSVVPRIDDRTLLVALCPLLAMSDTVVETVAASIALLVVAALTSSIVAITNKWVASELRLAASFITLALLVGIVELITLAWFPRLRASFGVFLPLIACNYALLRALDSPGAPTPTRSLRIAAIAAVAMLILGIARELVGHGSLMHDAGASLSSWFKPLEWTVFDLDMGFLLAMLPPGAFIAAGLLIALQNAWQLRERIKE